MKRYIAYFYLFVLSLFSACNVQPPGKEQLVVLNQPAEFDQQEALWLIWPPVDHKRGYSNEEVSLQIIKSVVPTQKMVVSCADSTLYQRAYTMLDQENLLTDQLDLIVLPSIELWVRDMGPSFVQTNQGLAIADFQFNAWGYSDSTDADTKVEAAYDKGAASYLNLPIISTSLISEGGNREVNGKGVLMLCERVEKGRNPGWTKEQMEKEFKRVLGVEEVLWLGEGVYEDDHTFLGPLGIANGEKAYTVVTTDGHIDEFARFVNDSTIVLGYVPEDDLEDPIAQENHRRMESNYTQLLKQIEDKGLNIRVERMPLPKTMVFAMEGGDSVYDYISTLEYQDGSTFPVGEPIKVISAGSYLNFTIANKVILGQKFWRAGMDLSIKNRDEEVERQLKNLFPKRDIVMIDAIAVNLGGGGLHCITMHQPLK